jgi:hypothetical protein
MKIYSLFLIFMIFSAFFVFNSLAETRLFVGVSPSIVDLGEVERGTTNLVKFFVVTTSEEPFLVHLQPENGRLEFFNFSYKDFIFNYSEENTDKWVKFLSNPVELKPQNETLKTSYETIKGWREVDFLLEIPKNAESGYHLIKINPIPSSPSTNIGGVGAQLVALTSVNILFKVGGDAIREGIILDTLPGGYIPNNLDIDTYFQNIGTITITAKAIQKIYDKDGNFITQLSSPTSYVKPKEVRLFESSLPVTGLSFGDYNIFTSVSYTTGTSYKNSTISITPEILVEKPKEEEFPIWIFIFIIIIIAFIIYRWIH